VLTKLKNQAAGQKAVRLIFKGRGRLRDQVRQPPRKRVGLVKWGPPQRRLSALVEASALRRRLRDEFKSCRCTSAAFGSRM